MTAFRPQSLVPVLAVAAVHCAPAGPAGALRMTIVGAERDASRIVRLTVDLTNTGDASLYLPGCGGAVSMWLQVRSGGAWQEFGGGLCPDNLDQTDVPMAPSQAIRGTAAVGGGDAGEYRALTSVSDHPGGQGEVVASSSVRVR